MSVWDGLVEIFNPGHKHFADERDRKRIEAQIPGSEGDPNKSWVDLDSGIVHLALPQSPMPASRFPRRKTKKPEPYAAELAPHPR